MKEIWRAVLVALLLLSMVTLLTLDKLTFVWTLRAAGHSHLPPLTQWCALVLVLAGPYAASLLQGLWSVSFLTKCRDTELPPLHNIILGVLSSILEAGAVSCFTCLVAPSLPAYLLLPILASVLALAPLQPRYNHAETKGEPDGGGGACGGRRQWLSLLSVCGLVLAAVILRLSGCLNWLLSGLLLLTLLLLALVWAPSIRYRTISTGGRISHNCRRLMVVYAALKLGALLVFMAVQAAALSGGWWALLDTWHSAGQVLTDPRLLLPLSLSWVFGALCHVLGFLSLTLCGPLSGLALPSLLSTVTSVILCVTGAGTALHGLDEIIDYGPFRPWLLSGVVVALGWLINLALWALHAPPAPRFFFAPYQQVMLDYGWRPGFSDLHRLLSYCGEAGSLEQEAEQASGSKKSRVYVCTTMYREADYEMERLLASLQKLSTGPCLAHVYLEAHIFMDNGVSQQRLGDFGQQLVGLLVSRLGVNPDECRFLATPYGLQLTVFVAGGMPLFLHLKDPRLVKPKKRWSQCMYINYIMNFRKTLWRQDSGYAAKTASKEFSDVFFISEEFGQKYSSSKPERTSPCRLPDIGYPTLTSLAGQFPPLRHDCEPAEGAARNPDSRGEMDVISEEALQDRILEEDGKISTLCTVSGGDEEQGTAVSRASPLYEFQFDPDQQIDDDHTYILATDADMDFEPEAVAELLRMCSNDHGIGAACGRTHPVGKQSSSIVWHQVFEYAKDFWMIKSAQNVIGSVMCCPGCFSLYRCTAIRQVMDKYATPTNTPFTVYVKDTGEDRWMATLMMIHGWRLRYSALADNTTYCPDTFEEFFKQRRRWILSDMANLLLVVRHLPALLRRNQCFSLVYVLYLLNMFMNNVITPGTAIVMITAGMELVFGVPYLYTTPLLAAIVYGYAFFCTRGSAHSQTALTTGLTLLLGGVFASVAVWGSYMIVQRMTAEIQVGHFQFQQHYIILMLTVSLLYAALVHPREVHEIVFGLAYLFIFPAMHLLLPIYSIANIIDQSWGTRDSQTAKIPKLRCVPNLRKLMKWRKKNKESIIQAEDVSLDIQKMVDAKLRPMSGGSAQEQREHAFWEELGQRLLGNEVNVGLERGELAERLQQLRNRSLLGVMGVNALWLMVLSYFYVGVDSPLARLNLYGVMSGALYGFTLVVQVMGMTLDRLHLALCRLAGFLRPPATPHWITPR